MVKSKRPCGKHVTLADNDGARISQCPCGVIHLLVKGSGVTVQLERDQFDRVGLAVMGAVSALGSSAQAVPRRPPHDSSIN